MRVDHGEFPLFCDMFYGLSLELDIETTIQITVLLLPNLFDILN
jgi:hypothetical protein